MIRLSDALEDFLIYLEGIRMSENTIKSYRSDLTAFITFVTNKRSTSNIEETDLKRICFNYLDTLRYYNKVEEYSIPTLNRKRIAMRKFIYFLHKREYISDNFGKQIEVIKYNKPATKDVLDDHELQIVDELLKSDIDNVKDTMAKYRAYRNRFIILTFIYTGIRVSELINLKWSNIDYTNNTILIEKGKGNKPRTVPINPEYKPEIIQYKELLSTIFSGNNNLFDCFIFFRDERNVKISITTKTVRKIIGDIFSRLTTIKKHISPHNLRHTFASHSIKGKMSITTLAGILGHAKTSITLDTYSHIINEQQKQDEMGKLTYYLS